MWTFHVRWKALYQLFVCSWQGHNWDQFHVIHPGWNSDDYYCKRCQLRHPAHIRGTEHTPEGRYSWSQMIDPDGVPIGSRYISGTNIKGMELGYEDGSGL